ncbi:PspC domain-containing protein [Actinomadura sp. 7K507]|uniref:PspC domain-containing protein n=1 Tax=Actinomadura sp. 7K507 TaxID=2530365 RepID=UPI00104CBB3C|nr:PspC domain-containing protein [Actinomadura sp. 7K507]TDC79630.1 hypothetical protein E1285_35825 [Actinomadura sp. 7K507]
MGRPVDHGGLLSRRERLFSPEPRLGWVFRDRWWFLRPFPEAPPRQQVLPDYLARRVRETEQLARRRLSRTLPISGGIAAVLLLYGACSAGSSPADMTAPIGALLLAVIVAAPGTALTSWAVRQRQHARQAYELAQQQIGSGYQEQTRQWQARKHAHDSAERARLDGLPEWGAAPRPGRRLDVFGGTLWAWEALLTTYGASTLAVQPLLVLDLSREVISRELVELSRAAWMGVDAQLLPSRQASSTLLRDMSPQDLVDAIVESMHGGTPDAVRADRSMDDRILTKVCGALGDDVTLGRIAAALRALMGEPDDGDVLTRDERRHIAGELFTVEYRRQAHASLSRIESYVHPLEDLGTEPSKDGTGYLTCIALDSQARNVRSELLTDLIVQWVTHRITASRDSTPALIVVGADELARRHLERLSDACERRGVPLTLLFRRLRETSAEMIGGGAVAFMRLGNHEDASRAADFIGRDHRFILSQITKNIGGNESHTSTDTQGEGDSETYSTSHTAGESRNWGTSRSSGVGYSGGEMFGLFPDRSTSYQRGRNRGGGTSTSDTEGTATSTSRNWSAAYSYAEGTNWSDADTTQRVYEYVVEPVTLQHLPDHALLMVVSAPGGGRTITPVECDPAIITLDRVTTGPLPDPPAPQAIPASDQPLTSPGGTEPRTTEQPRPTEQPPRWGTTPASQWATPPAPPPPRAPLSADPGAPPGQQTGPRGPGEPRQGPPPLFGGKS